MLRGLVTQQIDAYGVSGVQRTTSTVYDALDRPTTVTDPLGHVTTDTYDAAGELLTSTDGNGYTTSYGYDALGRRTTTTDPLSNVTTETYDAAGNEVKLTDADSNVTTMAYDALNQLTSQTDPLSHTATFAYDADGNQTATTDRDGRQRDITYDALNRQTGQTWYDSSHTLVNTQTFTYDAAGDKLTATDSSSGGGYTFGYDTLGRLSSQQGYGQTLTESYDAAGNRTSVVDSQAGDTTYVYDALGRLTEEDFGGSGQTPLKVTQTWTADDQLLTIDRYAQDSGHNWFLAGLSTYGYDNAGRMTSAQSETGNGANISDFLYSYDAGNRVTAVSMNGSPQATYTYDHDGELTGDGVNTLTFDATGNRTNGSNTVGTENQLTSDGTWTYTYDAEGNLTKKSKGASAETWTYGYNNLNHMVWAKDAATDGGTTLTYVTYKYDALGNRIEEDVWTSGTGTVTTDYAYDGQNVWADTTSGGSLEMRRLYSNAVDAVLARIDSSGNAAWYLTDRQGSVRDIQKGDGSTVLDHIDYDGWGNVTYESSPSNGDRYKYTGREWDAAVNLQYNRARYYDPTTGRWTSQDPLGFDAGDSNLYRYVENSPVSLKDPSGLAWTADDLKNALAGTAKGRAALNIFVRNQSSYLYLVSAQYIKRLRKIIIPNMYGYGGEYGAYGGSSGRCFANPGYGGGPVGTGAPPWHAVYYNGVVLAGPPNLYGVQRIMVVLSQKQSPSSATNEFIREIGYLKQYFDPRGGFEGVSNENFTDQPGWAYSPIPQFGRYNKVKL